MKLVYFQKVHFSCRLNNDGVPFRIKKVAFSNENGYKWTWPYFISCPRHKLVICMALNKFRINLASIKCLKGKSVKASSTAENRQEISWNNYVRGPTRKTFHCTVCSSLNTLFYNEQNLRFPKLTRTLEKLVCL